MNPVQPTPAVIDETLRRRNRLVLAALAALFFLPLALSFLMYYGHTWQPATRVNHGELIEPARTLPKVSLPVVAGLAPQEGPWAGFTGKWSLVYVGDGACDDKCRQALVVMRQTRLALNNDMTRVQRVFLAKGACCAASYVREEHPGLVVVDASGAAANELLLAFAPNNSSTSTSASAAPSIYVVDPLGNLMMRYDTQENPRGLLLDLQKLLRLSHIG